MTRLYYLAYGSNLHPRRLVERIPSASLIRMLMLRQHKVAFHKRGADASGKCNLLCTADTGDIAYAGLYRMDSGHKGELDRIEGAGYRAASIDITAAGERYHCFTYIAEDAYIDDGLRPFDWYKALVVLGAEHLGLPSAYVRKLKEVPAVSDPNQQRRREHETLIARIVDINRRHKLIHGIQQVHAMHRDPATPSSSRR